MLVNLLLFSPISSIFASFILLSRNYRETGVEVLVPALFSGLRESKVGDLGYLGSSGLPR